METDNACTCAVGNSHSTEPERLEASCADNQEAVVINLPDHDLSSSDHTAVNTSGDRERPQNGIHQILSCWSNIILV